VNFVPKFLPFLVSTDHLDWEFYIQNPSYTETMPAIKEIYISVSVNRNEYLKPVSNVFRRAWPQIPIFIP